MKTKLNTCQKLEEQLSLKRVDKKFATNKEQED